MQNADVNVVDAEPAGGLQISQKSDTGDRNAGRRREMPVSRLQLAVTNGQDERRELRRVRSQSAKVRTAVEDAAPGSAGRVARRCRTGSARN